MSECPKFEPLRDYADVQRVQNEMRRLAKIPSDKISEEESDLGEPYTRSLRIYMLFCPRRSLRLTPAQLLCYQLGVLRRIATDVAASEMGMPEPDLLAPQEWRATPDARRGEFVSELLSVCSRRVPARSQRRRRWRSSGLTFASCMPVGMLRRLSWPATKPARSISTIAMWARSKPITSHGKSRTRSSHLSIIKMATPSSC
jgi:hypothetical protein